MATHSRLSSNNIIYRSTAIPRYGQFYARKQRKTGRILAIPTAFHIDHKHHLNLAWERQKEREREFELAESAVNDSKVISIYNLSHLDHVLAAAGGRICVLYLYSCSCGVCKNVTKILEQVCQDSHNQKARIVFLKHDILSEYDAPSDLAIFYRVKSVPRFLFFVDGALVKTTGMNDVRQWKVTRSLVETVVDSEEQRLKNILFELLVKNAPSARR